jgi:hypothetical protein
VAIVAIQVQLLSMALSTASRAVLSISMILELLGILLAICLTQSTSTAHHHSQQLLTFVHRLPTLLILIGIIGLGAALVVETLETSLGTAVAMSSILLFGVVISFLTLLRGPRKVDGGDDDSDYS